MQSNFVVCLSDNRVDNRSDIGLCAERKRLRRQLSASSSPLVIR